MEKQSETASNLPSYKKAALQVIAYKRIRDAVNAVLNRFNLNTTQWIILGTLSESAPGMRITDIAHSLQVEVPLITTLSQPLLLEGLIRNKLNKADRRAKPLALTKHGKVLVSQIESELNAKLKPLEAGLSAREVDNYFQTLEIFISNARG